MANLNYRALWARSAAAVEQSRRVNQRLILIYCGVTALLSLGSNGLHQVLNGQIGSTGGLSGLGMRSVFQTVQELLSYINYFFGPFWSAGFLYAMIAMVRGRAPAAGNLTAGFRRFGRVLAHMAVEFLVGAAVGLAAMNLATVIFSFTPMNAELAAKLEPLLSDPALLTADGMLDLSKLPVDALMSACLPLLILTVVIAVPAFLYVSYCFRLSMYLVMDRPIGAVGAHVESVRLMRGHKMQMLKLDLRFWWYHLLNLVIALVGYLDVILARLGIFLPVDPTILFYGFLIACFVLQTGLFLWKKCQVDGTYVLAYDAIACPEQSAADPIP